MSCRPYQGYYRPIQDGHLTFRVGASYFGLSYDSPDGRAMLRMDIEFHMVSMCWPLISGSMLFGFSRLPAILTEAHVRSGNSTPF